MLRNRIKNILRRHRPAHMKKYMSANGGQLPPQFVTNHPQAAARITERYNQRQQNQDQTATSPANDMLQTKFMEMYNAGHPAGAPPANFWDGFPPQYRPQNGSNPVAVGEPNPSQPNGLALGQIPDHQNMNAAELDALRNQFREQKLAQMQTNPNRPVGYNGASLNPWSFVGEEEVENG